MKIGASFELPPPLGGGGHADMQPALAKIKKEAPIGFSLIWLKPGKRFF